MKMVTLVSNYKTALRYFAKCHLLVTGHGLRWFHMDGVNEPGGLVLLQIPSENRQENTAVKKTKGNPMIK